jgi:hypothetical protein
MATYIIKRKNFSAPLPPDFVMLKTLSRIDNKEQLACRQFPTPNDYCFEYFMIGKDRFFFSGHFSRRPIVKWLQKLKEHFFPVKYKVEYLSITEHNQLKTNG